jgi:DNA polymerase III sliding clamp (beta) subunit (PCNA family)
MPPFESFEDPESYYSTLGHESIHWTKHEKRLARDLGKKTFGDEGYAKEELVAELGAAFLCSDLSLVPMIRDDHAAYLGHWLNVLKADKRFIVTAAAHAQKAVDYLHSLQPKGRETTEGDQAEAQSTSVPVEAEVKPGVFSNRRVVVFEPEVADVSPPVDAGSVPEPEPSSPAAVPTPRVEGLLSVSVNPKPFLERFRAVALFAARKSEVPILETVQLEATGEGNTWLRAGNFDSECSLSVPVMKRSSPGVVQLSKDQVVKVMRDVKGNSVAFEGLPHDTLVLSSEPSQRTRGVMVRTTASSVALATFDPQRFPARRVQETATATVELPAWKLSRALSRTLYAADPDSTHSALGGVCLEHSGGTLRAIVTDGRCLASATETAIGTGLDAPKLIKVGEEERSLAPVVPLAAARALVEVLGVLEPNQKLTLGFTPQGCFQLEGKGLSMWARLLEGRFPNYQNVFPAESPFLAKLDSSLLLREVKSLAKLPTFEERGMTMRLEGAKLILGVQNAEATTSSVVPVVNLSGSPGQAVSVAIDPERLIPALEANRSSTLVVKFPPCSEDALRFECAGMQFLVMPMKPPG